MTKAKSTPVPMGEEMPASDVFEEEKVVNVFIAAHTTGGDVDARSSEILGVYSNEKEAKKCAAAAKKEDGYKGKTAKAHSYTVEPWVVSDKFDGF